MLVSYVLMMEFLEDPVDFLEVLALHDLTENMRQIWECLLQLGQSPVGGVVRVAMES